MPPTLCAPHKRQVSLALAGLLLLVVAAGCSPAPPVVVLAPSATPAGAVVPTRAPTVPAAPTPEPSAIPASPTPAPTDMPSSTPPPEAELAGQDIVLSAPAAAVDSTWSGIISDMSPWAIYPLRGEPGELVDLKLDGINDLQPLLLLLDPDGREIARSESEPPNQQAAIRGASLESGGAHYVVVTRKGGQDGTSSGAYTLTITSGVPGQTEGEFSADTTYESLVRGQVSGDDPEKNFVFAGRAGDILTVQVTAQDNLDTQITLSDALGNLLAANDDDPLGDTLSSAIHQFVLPADGYYALTVSSFGDTAGEFSVKLAREGQVTSLTDPAHALLDLVNSSAIRDDGARVTDFRVGDQVTDGGELRVQTLVTYHLPDNFQGRTPVVAQLELNACAEGGTGFAGFEPMRVYKDPYGTLDSSRDFTRLQVGAVAIAELTECAPVDVSEAVNAAYAQSRTEIQFRLAFPAANGNGQTDEVRFDPRLLISAAG